MPEPKQTEIPTRGQVGTVKGAICRWGVLSSIVLRGGKATYRGKDLTEVRSPQRKLVPDTVGPKSHEPTSLRGIALRVLISYSDLPVAKASTTEEPDAGKLHVRVCAGGAG